MAPTNTSDSAFVPTAFLPSMTTYQAAILVYITVGSMGVRLSQRSSFFQAYYLVIR